MSYNAIRFLIQALTSSSLKACSQAYITSASFSISQSSAKSLSVIFLKSNLLLSTGIPSDVVKNSLFSFSTERISDCSGTDIKSLPANKIQPNISIGSKLIRKRRSAQQNAFFALFSVLLLTRDKDRLIFAKNKIRRVIICFSHSMFAVNKIHFHSGEVCF